MTTSGDAAESMTGAQAMPAEKCAETDQTPASYVDASAAFSSLLIGSEIARIARYTAEVEARANNLGVLWMQEPFRKDLFLEEAAAIVRQSDEIEDNVAMLKNTVVRFMRSRIPDQLPKARRTGRRRRIGRHERVVCIHQEKKPDAGEQP